MTKLAKANRKTYIFVSVRGIIIKLFMPQTLRHYPQPLPFDFPEHDLHNQLVPRHGVCTCTVIQFFQQNFCESLRGVDYRGLLVLVVLEFAAQDLFYVFFDFGREESKQ